MCGVSMKRVLLVMFTGLFLVSCNVDSEKDDLAKAQKCLDEIPVSAYAQAANCLQYVQKYSSQQANILKCSISMTSGGLVETKIVAAYEALKQAGGTQQAREAQFMALLSFDDADNSKFATAFTTAKSADQYCQDSGVGGLRYLSGLIVTGTYMKKLAALIDPSITSSTPPATIVQNIIDNCVTPVPGANCPLSNNNSADINAMGAAVADLAQSYCDRADADVAVCSGINSAIQQGGLDTADIGQALLCYIGGKVLDQATQTCKSP